MQQIVFPFKASSSFSVEDFLVLPSNENAFKTISTLLQTQTGMQGCVLYGSKGVGKTHLAHIAAGVYGAGVVSASDVEFPQEMKNVYILDDLHLASASAQENLFHIFNDLQKKKGILVCTSAEPVSQLKGFLKDLTSRLLTLPQIEIEAPKDTHLELFLVKFASDHQVHIEPNVVKYILNRTGRNLSSLMCVLDKLDKASLQHHKRITIPFVKNILGF